MRLTMVQRYCAACDMAKVHWHIHYAPSKEHNQIQLLFE